MKFLGNKYIGGGSGDASFIVEVQLTNYDWKNFIESELKIHPELNAANGPYGLDDIYELSVYAFIFENNKLKCSFTDLKGGIENCTTLEELFNYIGKFDKIVKGNYYIVGQLDKNKVPGTNTAPDQAGFQLYLQLLDQNSISYNRTKNMLITFNEETIDHMNREMCAYFAAL